MSTMRYIFWILLILMTLGAFEADDNLQKTIEPEEVFCTDGVRVFYVSADRDVTSPPTKPRLRVLRMPGGTLLLVLEGQLPYPFVPNVTPAFLSEKDNLILLPDLDSDGAAIGLQLPDGLLTLFYQLLYKPPPSENVVKVLTKAEALAAGVVHKAEAFGQYLNKKAASMQEGDPSPPVPHPWWRRGAGFTRKVSEQVPKVASMAFDLLGKAVDGVIAIVTFPLNKEEKLVSNSEEGNGAKPVKSLGGEINDDKITTATIKALDTILEALKAAAKILGTSIRENTVKVMEHKFGEDMALAMDDVIKSVGNILGPMVEPGETPLGKCKTDL